MMRTLIREFLAAATLLTRLPFGMWVQGPWPTPARCLWAYPLVGGLVGMAGAVLLWAGRALSLPPLVDGILAVSAMTVATGGLHEDGLADTFDALGGGRDACRRLEILRDSRIGAHGALALLLIVILRAALIGALPSGNPSLPLIAACCLGRAALLPPLLFDRPARTTGLGASVAPGEKRGPALIGIILVVPLLALLPAAFVAATLACLSFAAFASRRFGGFSGDTLGATALLAECAALAASVDLGAAD